MEKSGIDIRKVTNWLLIIAAILVLLIYFQNLLKPFVLALVFWYFLRELRIRLGKIPVAGKKMPRWLLGTIALIIMLAVIVSVSDLLISSIDQIVRKIPQYGRIEDNFINELAQKLNIQDLVIRLENSLKNVNITGFLSNLLNSLTSTIGNIVMIIIYVVFLLIEEIIFAGKIRIISETNERYNQVKNLLERINNSIRRYIMLKTIVSLSTGIMSYIILVILGIDFPILWAFVIFLFNYIPYVGSLVATLLPSIFSMFQFNDPLYFIWVFLAIQAVQTINANYLEPKIMGKSLNLSPLVVVLSLTVWGAIWGILGMLLSVPIMSVLTIIMAQFPGSKNIAVMLSETGDINSLIVNNTKPGDANMES